MSTFAPRRPRRHTAAQGLFDDRLVWDAAPPSVASPPSPAAPAPPSVALAHPAPTTSGGGRLTLEQRLASVWEGLLAAGEASCPVCAGRLLGRPGGGTCATCGARVE